MLPLIYTNKYPGIEAEYNASYAHRCLNDYLGLFKNGKERYDTFLRELALKVYEMPLAENPSARYYLDKTPRYYHIIKELIALFPKAKILLLVRNPLSVFASILDYNLNGNVLELMHNDDRICDLITAPRNIAEVKKRFAKHNILFVHYEHIIENAKNVLTAIYSFLELHPPQDVDRYSISDCFRNTTSVDTKSLHRHDRPHDAYLTSWKRSIDDRAKKSVAIEYIKLLGEKTIGELGYSYEDIMMSLSHHNVNSRRLLGGINPITQRYCELSSYQRKKIAIISGINRILRKL